MNRKWTIIWLILVFTIFLVLAIHSFHEKNPLLLIISEFTIPLLFAITVRIVIKSLKPVTRIGKSLDLLREGDFNTTLVKTGNKDADNLIDVFNSMVKKLREQRLSVREKNQFLDLLIESSPLGIVILDLDERIMHINSAAFKCFGIQSVDSEGRLLNDLDSNLAKQIQNIRYDDKQLVISSDARKFLCRKLYFMDRGFRHPFYIIEEFTEEIKKAEREAYGKLIRMMAHEVNNTVGSVNSIMTSVQSGRESLNESERDEIEKILGVAIQRNYQLNRFMQNFSNFIKLPPPEKVLININDSVSNVAESFRIISSERKTSIETRFAKEPLMIFADRSQMEQVFSNLIKNSIEAINGEGRIIVETKDDPVSISFLDNGSGLTDKVFSQIFTPFFSTKPGGQGIGLMVIQEILANHGFSYYFRNREPGGTEFIINC